MENIVLTIHLILALCLIAVVLMQRSEGGGLGIGGGGGGGGLVSGRGAATALSKLTWAFFAGFIVTSLTLTVMASQGTNAESVIDRLGVDVEVPAGEDLLPQLPPALEGDLVPPAPGDGPAAPPAE